jgi:hypothetical protein
MALKKHSAVEPAAEQAFSLLELDPKQLLALRSDIDRMLGMTSLTDIDIENEILVQLATAKQLQADTLVDSDVPANQKAQTINSVAAILRELTKMQTELYNAERIKEIEAAVVSSMGPAPKDVKDAFFERYERLLTGKNV